MRVSTAINPKKMKTAVRPKTVKTKTATAFTVAVTEFRPMVSV